MRGRRPGKTGGVFAGIHRGFFRAEHDTDGRGSFAAEERSMSDRFLGEGYGAGDISKTFTAIAFCFIFLTNPTYETSRIILVNCER